MAMERYIIFIRNNKNAEEFIATRRAHAGAHKDVMEAMALRYPTPQYVVHTCYTDAELQDILDTIDRWTGTAVDKNKHIRPQLGMISAGMKPLSITQK